jgi:hypothetical protein
MFMATTVLWLSGLIVFGVIVHTAIVQLAAVWRSRIEADADTVMARICAGQTTNVDIRVHRENRIRHEAQLADASEALHMIPSLDNQGTESKLS